MTARILILEDNELAAKVLRHVLEMRGHECEGVATAEAALACVPRFSPDIVLYEWALVGGYRYGLAHQLRALKADLFIVTLSALDEPDGFCRAEAVDGYLTKPFSLASLEAILERRLLRG